MNQTDLLKYNINVQPIPSVFNEGYSQYETLSKLLLLINQMIENMNLGSDEISKLISQAKHLDVNGNFTGTWNGLPMQSSELGLATDWNSAKGTYPTVTERLNSYDVQVNVKSFGAKGDGLTDDRLAIQNAINSLPNGGTIIFPQGTYILSKVVGKHHCLLAKSNIRFLGYNSLLKAKDDETDSYLILIGNDGTQFTKIDNIIIDGLSFQGHGFGVGEQGAGIAIQRPLSNTYGRNEGCSNIEIKNCKFLGGFCFSVVGSGVTGIKIHNSFFTGNYYYPATSAGGYCNLFQSCFDVEVYHNFYLATQNDRHAIYVSEDGSKTSNYNNENVDIHDNIFDWQLANAGTGFESVMMVRSVKGIIIHDNEINGGYSGIECEPSNGDINGFNIHHNHFRNQRSNGTNDRACIGFVSNATYNIKNLFITENIIDSTNDHVFGITVVNVNNFKIDDNVVNVSGGYSTAIQIYGATKGEVKGNIITGSNTTYAGLRYVGTFTDVIIGKNKITGCGWVEKYEGSYVNTSMIHNYVRSAKVSANGSGTISASSDEIGISSIAGQFYGVDITFGNGWKPDVTNFSLNVTFGNFSNWSVRGVSGQTLQLNINNQSWGQSNLSSVALDFWIKTFS